MNVNLIEAMGFELFPKIGDAGELRILTLDARQRTRFDLRL